MATKSPSRTKVEPYVQDQSSRMPIRQLLTVYFGIGLALMVSFMDQTSVSTAAPIISTDLGGSASMSWIGTSFFVSSCALQLVYGRLSDIFGRKQMLQIALLLLATGNLACSFARTPIQLYIFRAISGTGGGGINNIAMVSDVVPLKERGKYQGLVSAACSLGNAIGPFVGGGLAGAGQWRWLFRATAILGFLVIILVHFIIPFRPLTGSMRRKLLQIDYLGVFLSSAATVLLLVPISGGGSTFSWNSAVVIALLIAGIGCGVGFILCEWRIAKLPILPLRLFKAQTPAVVMVQSFFIGIILYGNIFYVPMFFQYAKGYTPLVSGSLVLAYILPQSMWGILAGFYISKTNHYKRIIIAGAAFWTLGVGLQIMWTADSSLGETLGFLEISSVGVGLSLQTTMIAALATTDDKDRAVVTGGRNFFRTLGGAFGLAMANAIYQATVNARLADIASLTSNQRSSLLDAALSNLDSYPGDVVLQIRAAYAGGLRTVFISFTVIAAFCTAISFLIKEVTFRKDPIGPSPELPSAAETPTESSTRTSSELLEKDEETECHLSNINVGDPTQTSKLYHA